MTIHQEGHTHAHPGQPGAENAQVGDFEALVLRFQGPITTFMYHLLGNREQACDLAQDVFVKAYKALLGGTAVPAGNVSIWLYRIAANTVTQALRRRRLISWLPVSLFCDDDRGSGAGAVSTKAGTAVARAPFDGSLAGNTGWRAIAHTQPAQGGYRAGCFGDVVADRELVERVFRRLPPRSAVCLWLYEQEGLSCVEIAAVLAISPRAVKKRLTRARERFALLDRQNPVNSR